MNKYEEILLEIDGKIAYADSTGNMQAKYELIEISNAIKVLKRRKEEFGEISRRNEKQGEN